MGAVAAGNVPRSVQVGSAVDAAGHRVVLIEVMAGFECPNKSCNRKVVTCGCPALWVAKVWRNECGVTRLVIPAAAQYLSSNLLTLLGWSGSS